MPLQNQSLFATRISSSTKTQKDLSLSRTETRLPCEEVGKAVSKSKGSYASKLQSPSSSRVGPRLAPESHERKKSGGSTLQGRAQNGEQSPGFPLQSNEGEKKGRKRVTYQTGSTVAKESESNGKIPSHTLIDILQSLQHIRLASNLQIESLRRQISALEEREKQIGRLNEREKAEIARQFARQVSDYAEKQSQFDKLIALKDQNVCQLKKSMNEMKDVIESLRNERKQFLEKFSVNEREWEMKSNELRNLSVQLRAEFDAYKQSKESQMQQMTDFKVKAEAQIRQQVQYVFKAHLRSLFNGTMAKVEKVEEKYFTRIELMQKKLKAIDCKIVGLSEGLTALKGSFNSRLSELTSQEGGPYDRIDRLCKELGEQRLKEQYLRSQIERADQETCVVRRLLEVTKRELADSASSQVSLRAEISTLENDLTTTDSDWRKANARLQLELSNANHHREYLLKVDAALSVESLADMSLEMERLQADRVGLVRKVQWMCSLLDAN